MKPTDFIGANVTYDKDGQMIWGHNSNHTQMQLIADVRGWGAIQNRFKTDSKKTAKLIWRQPRNFKMNWANG